MVRYFFLLVPYLFQLLCIIHAIRNRKDTFWFWIIIFVPYVGGAAYLIVEILPEIINRRNVGTIRKSIVNLVNPNQAIEEIKKKAEYSPTHTNRMEYASALMNIQDFEGAYAIYEDEAKGLFGTDPEVVYNEARALFSLKKYDESLVELEKLRNGKEETFQSVGELCLFLSIIEKTKPYREAIEEYKKVNTSRRNYDIDLQYVDFLKRNDDLQELKAVFARIHKEAEMAQDRNPFQRAFFKKVFQIERSLGDRVNR